jgi:hypothetical protein
MNSTLQSPARFVGIWELQPEHSYFEQGEPLQSCTYSVAFDGEQLHFHIIWTTADGQKMQQIIDTIPDGVERPFPGSMTVDAACFTLVDSNTLDSTAKSGGKVVATTRRVLSEDGESMTHIQQGQTPEGHTFTNRSTFRRKPV